MTTETGTLSGAGLFALVGKINSLAGVIAVSGAVMAAIEITAPSDRGFACSFAAGLPWCALDETSAERDRALLAVLADEIMRAQTALDEAIKTQPNSAPALQHQVAGLEAERATLTRAIDAASAREKTGR
jgi:hypothetical protein